MVSMDSQGKGNTGKSSEKGHYKGIRTGEPILQGTARRVGHDHIGGKETSNGHGPGLQNIEQT
jgi:hypothetical protein